MHRTNIPLAFFTILLLSDMIFAQRGFYSGARPQGYKDKYVPQIETTINNRFDTQPINTPDGRVPVNAHNDIYLVNYLSSLPRDKQPFWFINYQQLEAQRGLVPTQTQTVTQSPVLGTSTINTGNTGASNTQQNTQVSNRFDEQPTYAVYQQTIPEGQRLGPFKVVVGLPPSNNLF